MVDMNKLMKQARQLQEKMAKMQEELATKTVEASTGGGMVKVVASGKREIQSIEISPEVVNPDDIEMLQDLTLAAINEALRKAEELATAEMAKVAGGINLKIPGLM
ncbi:MAG: YbaB/EbfC family nucleoid-associated protein [Candidatus Abyssobacteria bacterium SURF_17]|uniref:Nucleoid-associated protein C4532_18850 n=1 Tax=Candidatus Abyssobacteria bacterium SURF_17 TaxID=2093361 RepID=A0A419EPA0_9BACT|nr:MAG: YbaB/EbfC family nucleoid-associated protein [Candidatus Abyssubacteria bacterium SURF_17]